MSDLLKGLVIRMQSFSADEGVWSVACMAGSRAVVRVRRSSRRTNSPQALVWSGDETEPRAVTSGPASNRDWLPDGRVVSEWSYPKSDLSRPHPTTVCFNSYLVRSSECDIPGVTLCFEQKIGFLQGRLRFSHGPDDPSGPRLVSSDRIPMRASHDRVTGFVRDFVTKANDVLWQQAVKGNGVVLPVAGGLGYVRDAGARLGWEMVARGLLQASDPMRVGSARGGTLTPVLAGQPGALCF